LPDRAGGRKKRKKRKGGHYSAQATKEKKREKKREKRASSPHAGKAPEPACRRRKEKRSLIGSIRFAKKKKGKGRGHCGRKT